MKLGVFGFLLFFSCSAFALNCTDFSGAYLVDARSNIYEVWEQTNCDNIVIHYEDNGGSYESFTLYTDGILRQFNSPGKPHYYNQNFHVNGRLKIMETYFTPNFDIEIVEASYWLNVDGDLEIEKVLHPPGEGAPSIKHSVLKRR